MKKINFILLVTILSSPMAAQNIIKFNQIDSVISGMPCFSPTVLMSQGGYLLYGETSDSAGLAKVSVLKIDSTGKFKWTKSYGKSGNNYNSSIIGGGAISIPWGGYTGVGNIANTSSTTYNLALYRFDNNGDTLWTKSYLDSANLQGWQIKITRNKKYIVGGAWVYKNTFYTMALAKFDSLGNKIWRKTYGGGSRSRYILGLDTCKDGGFIISADDYDTGAYCGGTTIIMKTDSAGNPQWTKSIVNGVCDIYGGGIIALKHGCYALCGVYDDSIQFSGAIRDSRMFIAKLDQNGNVKWLQKYGNDEWYGGPTLNTVRELANGDLIACGFGSTNVLGAVLKIDSNGNQIWLRYYKKQSPNEQDYLRDIQPTSDGGFISSGLTYGSTEDFWVIKTDSLGCADSAGCNFLSVSEQKMDKVDVRLYPDPNNGRFTIVLPNVKIKEQIQIFNILGEKIYDKATISTNAEIDMGNNPNGIYLYRILTETGNLVSEGKFIIQ